MKLLNLHAERYRSIREAQVDFGGLDLFIGANASGKSAILDALRFLQEGVQARDFRNPVHSRGGILHLPWKGEEAKEIRLNVRVEDEIEGNTCEWSVRLFRSRYEFIVVENVHQVTAGSPPVTLLEADTGKGWWWSGDDGKVELEQGPTSCALAAAAADATFPARALADFVSRWGFFDPNPFLLRRDWASVDSGSFDPYGRNLAETLYALENSSPDLFKQIVEATGSVVGLPSAMEARLSESGFYFVQKEPGLQYSVHQMGVSSGTLRMLALMTALHGYPEASLIGIEEPENYVHPTALSSFVDHLLDARERVQFLITTHSPMLLDLIDDPGAVRVVSRGEEEGTTVESPKNADDVRRALDASGFGLGEYFETTGFGN